MILYFFCIINVTKIMFNNYHYKMIIKKYNDMIKIYVEEYKVCNILLLINHRKKENLINS